MISYTQALQSVLNHSLELGNEPVAILKSMGRVLSEDILADRDFPPFDRSTKDGISIGYSAIEKGSTRFKIEGVASAGMPEQTLSSDSHCLEIMTGAVLPKNADTIIMYEQTDIENGWATISKIPQKGQNIHLQASDKKAGEVLLERGIIITAAVIGILASVGKTEVLVKKLPKICVVSTGDELVEVSDTPLPHQIRKSNTLTLTAALGKIGIAPTQLHLADDLENIEKGLRTALMENDVLMLSGGVSKGKFDFIPDALEALGVQKIFHRVAQRPGKPFWFGIRNTKEDNQKVLSQKDSFKENQSHPQDLQDLNIFAKGEEPQKVRDQKPSGQVIFSFPGNPVSTFANYHVYFLPWLAKCLGTEMEKRAVIMDGPVPSNPSLTLFLQVKTEWQEGELHARLVAGNGSGDLVNLAKADGFICVPAGDLEAVIGEKFQFIPSV